MEIERNIIVADESYFPAPEENSREKSKLLKSASDLEKQQDFGKAASILCDIKEYERAIDLYLRDGHFSKVGDIYLQIGDINNAINFYKQDSNFLKVAELLDKSGNHQAAAHYYLKEKKFQDAGRCFQKSGALKEALNCFFKSEDFEQIAEIYIAENQYESAVMAYERAYKKASENPTSNSSAQEQENARRRCQERLGHCHIKLKKFDRAAEIFSGLKDHKKAGYAYFLGGQSDAAANEFIQGGDLEKAISVYQSVGDTKKASRVRGNLAYKKGMFKEAAEYYIKSGKQLLAAKCLVKCGQYVQAAQLYEKLGQPDEARELYRLAKKPESKDVNDNKNVVGLDGMEVALGPEKILASIGNDLKQLDPALNVLNSKSGNSVMVAAAVMDKVAANNPAPVAGAKRDPVELASLSQNFYDALQEWQQTQNKFSIAPATTPESLHASGRIDAPEDVVPTIIEKIGPDVQSAMAAKRPPVSNLKVSITSTPHGPGQDIGPSKRRSRRLPSILQKLALPEMIKKPWAVDAASPSSSLLSQASGSKTPIQLERYTVLNKIGEGGMGEVYLAKDNILGRNVACKIYSLDNYSKSYKEELLLKEAKTTAILNHQNIVTLFDIGLADDFFFLAMEYVEGKSLKEMINEPNKLNFSLVIDIFRQVCRGLNCAHEKSIVHLDVKPANIMRSDVSRTVKIMDFGIAKVLRHTLEQGMIMFTPHYVAPEQIRGHSVDYRTDIYSLGVTMFEVSTRELPFKNGDYLYHHLHSAPPNPRDINPDLPAEFARILLKCMEKKPEDRYSSVKEILQDLDQFPKKNVW